MAFVRVTAIHRPRRGLGETVTMGLYLANGKDIQRKTISFRFSNALLRRLGWVNSEGVAASLVSVAEGIGEDIGFWQLAPDKEGYTLSLKTKVISPNQGRTFAVNVDALKHYVLNEPGPISARPAAHIVEGDTLIIEVPDWLKFNPQSIQNGAAHQTHVVALPPPVVTVPSTLRSTPHMLSKQRGRPRKER